MIELGAMSSTVWAEVAGRVRGVFADVDDTLTLEGRLVPAAYEALCALAKAGVRVVLCTGRPVGWAEVLATLFPIDAAIAENGAVAVLPRAPRLYFDADDVRRAGAERQALARARVLAELPWIRSTRDEVLRETDLAFDIAEHERVSEADVARIIAILAEHDLASTRSSIHLHGTFSAADKAKMCVRTAQLLWNERERDVAAHYLYVGDSPNDAAAFAFFEHSVGVANVRAHVPALETIGAALGKSCVPTYVTSAAGGAGFAELASALLRN